MTMLKSVTRQLKVPVAATVVGDVKGKKVIVYKYKRKTGYHKNGHRRQPYTKVKIEKINA